MRARTMTILISLIVIAAVIFGFVSTRPDEFRVTRTRLIKAPASALFESVNDLVKWQSWSPWARLDTTAKMVFTNNTAGNGASMRWDGNSKIGKGALTITDSQPGALVQYRLDFEKPMKGTSVSDMAFTQQSDGTLVTWSMYGKNNFAAKLMSLVMNCDKMVGGQFEQGLSNLAAVTEK